MRLFRDAAYMKDYTINKALNINYLKQTDMKTRIFNVLLILGMSSLTLFAGNKTDKFKVAGNCGMCETRIETAAKSLEGVSAADWNKDTKMIEVTFDDGIIELHAIHKAIAEVGHDTDVYSAKDEVYDKLPACCKYERLSEEKGSEMRQGA